MAAEVREFPATASAPAVLRGDLLAGGLNKKPVKLRDGTEHKTAWVKVRVGMCEVFVGYWTGEQAREALGQAEVGDRVELPVYLSSYRGKVQFHGTRSDVAAAPSGALGF